MTKKNLILSYFLLIALAIFGAWLNGQFTDNLDNVSGLRLLLGLIILIGSIFGILFLIRNNRKPMNQSQKFLWESIRTQGKGKYIRSYVLSGSLIGLGSIAFALLKDYWSGKPFDFRFNNLVLMVALPAIFIGGSYYAAIRTWAYNEWEYNNAPDSKPQPNNSFNRSAS